MSTITRRKTSIIGLRNGFGIETCKNGTIYYLGGWEENLFQGDGIEMHAQRVKPDFIENNFGMNLIKRKGQFKAGKLSGYVCYENLDGDVKVGEFNDGSLLE